MDVQDAVSAAYWKGVAQAKENTLNLQAVEFKQRDSRWLARIAELEAELERERRYSQTKAAGERSWQQIAENTATEHDATLAKVAELEAERSSWHECYMGAVRTMEEGAKKEDRLKELVRPIYRHVHETHAPFRWSGQYHDPDCLLCHQIDALYAALER